MQIRKATMNDLPDILAIYAYAREYMKEHGNPDQWKDNYPPLELTTQDIRSGCLHVCIIQTNEDGFDTHEYLDNLKETDGL